MMPTLSVWILRLSLVYLFITAISGSVLLIHKSIPLHPAAWSLLPIHFEMAIWGWLVQFVMGTAYWMFPRYLTGPKRGNEIFAVISVVLLNTGILLLISAPFISPDNAIKAISRLVIVVSVALFSASLWNRVLSYRRVPH
ncbi:MAG: hypothetical protein JJU37_14735 [Balneolaceae bacterium]|nr:hypothetical protein [Balneolaceae bacterium]